MLLLHTTGFSDPYVQILLMPERRFKIKAVKTDYKNKDLNPTYYKEFKMYVRMYVCMCMCVCICVCMCVCMYISILKN